MNRLLLILVLVMAVVACGLVAALTGLWQIANAPEPAPPKKVQVPDLSGESTVTWSEAGDVHIAAMHMQDAASAMGYVHGWRHAWTLALWRQAAEGRLSEWFGAQALPADRLARSLGLFALAEESLHSLPPDEYARIQAYAAGVAAAWEHPSIPQRAEFLLLGYDLDRWEPAHTLAIERLMAYLATVVECAAAATYCTADRTLRRMIRVHGFSASLAWAVREDEGTILYQRHSYGSSAHPAFQEVIIELEGSSLVHGASLIGTPFLIGGHAVSGSWATLLASDAQLSHEARAPVSLQHERILDDLGHEHLLVIDRSDGQLRIEQTSDTTAWVLTWPGLTLGSDAAAWNALLTGQAGEFGMFSGPQLLLSPDGDWQVIGSPLIRTVAPNGILIGQDPSAGWIGAPDPSWQDALSWTRDTYSAVASESLPGMLRTLGGARRPPPSALSPVLTYLVNWDYEYTRSSVGASVYDAWMRELELHAPLGNQDADELLASLERAADSLAAQHGTDADLWRWEDVQPEVRYFPIAQVPAAQDMPRFQPLEWPGQGHASTSRWAPRDDPAGLNTSAAIESWHTIPFNGSYHVRRRPHPVMGFIARHASDSPDPAVLVLPTGPVRITTLVP